MDSLLLEKCKIKLKQIREKMSTFDAYFTKGIELYDKKKYKLSIELLKIALSQNNAQPYANYNLALAYQQIKKDSEALESYEKFLEYYPEDQNTLYNCALIYLEKQDYKKSAYYAFKSFKLKQDELNIELLTQSYLELNEIQKILDSVTYIFNSDCDKNLAYIVAQRLENSAYEKKDKSLLDYALEIYLKLLEYNPKHFDALLATSISYAKKGNWESAIEYCQKALDVNPNSFEANNQLGMAYYCSENMDECLRYYKKAFSINSKTDDRIYLNLAYAYEKIGRETEALELLKDAIIKFPNSERKREMKEHAKVLNKNIKVK